MADFDGEKFASINAQNGNINKSFINTSLSKLCYLE